MNRLRVIIHGGLHKSGTTSFQGFMASSRGRLLEAGVSYAGPKPHHTAILNTKDPAWDGRALRAAVETAKAAGAHTLLLSAEVVCSIGVSGFRSLAEGLADCDLAFLFVFRHWSSFLTSRWAQNCKRRDTQTFGMYVDRTLAWVDHVDHRFDLVLRQCLEGAGASIIALSFDRAMHEHKSIIPALVEALSLPELLKDAPEAATWANATFNRESIELVRLVNGVIADRLDLPQDDLFMGRGEHRKCAMFFDAGPAIRSLPAEQRDKLLEFGRATQSALDFEADWRPPAADLLDGFADLFVNAPDGVIFPARPARTETYWSLEWPDIADDPLFADPVERALSTVRWNMSHSAAA